jgi:hypothetical protein
MGFSFSPLQGIAQSHGIKDVIVRQDAHEAGQGQSILIVHLQRVENSARLSSLSGAAFCAREAQDARLAACAE